MEEGIYYNKKAQLTTEIYISICQNLQYKLLLKVTCKDIAN
jgi:hypothetical protein